MKYNIIEIEKLWKIRNLLNDSLSNFIEYKKIIKDVILDLDQGKILVCEKDNNQWKFNEWIKKAILLNFLISKTQIYDSSYMTWYDKIELKSFVEEKQNSDSENKSGDKV